jgi:hypothetical protein
MNNRTPPSLRQTAASLITLLALGCGPLQAQTGTPTPTEVDALTAQTRQAGLGFLRKLVGTLQMEMQLRGAASAVQVCSDKAPQMAAQFGKEQGWSVTRVGTRVRNRQIGVPDEWEQQVLKRFDERHAAGEAFDAMEHAEVVRSTDGTPQLRYMKAIGLQPQCLACHGQPEQIEPAVQARLQQLYPQDQATGYAPGQLRGALSIKRPL